MCCCFFKAAARLREKITRRWPRVCHVRLPELSMVEMAENPAALHSPHILPHTTFISNMMRYTDLSKISERKHCKVHISIHFTGFFGCKEHRCLPRDDKPDQATNTKYCAVPGCGRRQSLQMIPLDSNRTTWINFIFNDVPADEVKHCPSVCFILLRIVL